MKLRVLPLLMLWPGLMLLPVSIQAGDYHFGDSLVCSDCHVMHDSQTHGYNPDSTGVPASGLGAGGPHRYLLRNDIGSLCLSCHDGASGPDVLAAHGDGYPRQAGALNEVGGNALYPPATGHTLGSTEEAPGGTWKNDAGLNCADCHQVHGANIPGASSYRNLGGFGTEAGSGFVLSYTSTPADGPNPGGPTAAWIHEDANSGVNASHYGVQGITFNEPVADSSGYGEFCQSCHGDFHGDVGGGAVGGTGSPAEAFVRHPASTANIGALGGGHSSLVEFASRTNQVPVMSPGGKKAGTYLATDTDLTPSCMSCHKAHGNRNAFGLITMQATGLVTEEGTALGTYEDLCWQCHVQGSGGGSGGGFPPGIYGPGGGRGRDHYKDGRREP